MPSPSPKARHFWAILRNTVFFGGVIVLFIELFIGPERWPVTIAAGVAVLSGSEGACNLLAALGRRWRERGRR